MQYGRKTNGVLGKDGDYGDVVMNTGIYEKIFKKHWPTYNENIVATVNEWDHKIKNRSRQE